MPPDHPPPKSYRAQDEEISSYLRLKTPLQLAKMPIQPKDIFQLKHGIMTFDPYGGVACDLTASQKPAPHAKVISPSCKMLEKGLLGIFHKN